MEPRARAGKNVGKETFPSRDVAQLLYGFGDVAEPLPETVRVTDEIVTEFLEGVCFEASRHATASGRQKLKYNDFEFSMRRNPRYLGKIKTMMERRKKMADLRKTIDVNDDAIAKEAESKEKQREAAAAGAGGRGADDEELGDDLDDAEIMGAIKAGKKGAGSTKG